MINSIKFPNRGKGYIYEKFEMTRTKPDPQDWKYRETVHNHKTHKLEDNLSLKELIAPYLDRKNVNESWLKSYRACIDYLAQYPDFEKKGAYTLIFDEMDKSLDVETVIDLYQRVLPALHEHYGCQIITVSHSPILTTPYFRKNSVYNIIDMDPEYTSEVTSKMNELYK